MTETTSEKKLQWHFRNGKMWMFDDEDIMQRQGRCHRVVEKFYDLKEVEDFFSTIIEDYPFGITFDISALEKPHFGNLNYTNFSDFFIMHPLSPDISYQQTIDALTFDSDDNFDYVEYYKKRIEEGVANKYAGRNSATIKKYNAVVVLPALVKIRSHICNNKLRHIAEEHGKHAIFKPHPLTTKDELNQIMEMLQSFTTVVDPDEDVYEYILNADYLYTSHWSETVLAGVALDKKMEPIDTFQNRLFGSFSHINHQLFNSLPNERKTVLNKIFNNYRSGMVNPNTQPDWKERMVKYLDYILEKRNHVKTHYIGRI